MKWWSRAHGAGLMQLFVFMYMNMKARRTCTRLFVKLAAVPARKPKIPDPQSKNSTLGKET
jgi:hypothetical protein